MIIRSYACDEELSFFIHLFYEGNAVQMYTGWLRLSLNVEHASCFTEVYKRDLSYSCLLFPKSKFCGVHANTRDWMCRRAYSVARHMILQGDKGSSSNGIHHTKYC